jgi:hypothetical protein
MVAIKGHFDGKVIVPDEPLQLRPNQRLIVHVQPVEDRATDRRPAGLCAGEFTVPDDFDAPLPDDVLKDFEG